MGIFFIWVILSIIVGAIGSSRNIGFGGAFLLSLVLSPLIGLIITLISKDTQEEKRKAEMLKTQQRQTAALEKSLAQTNQQSIAEELEKISKLKEKGDITAEEYQKLKNSIIAKFD